MPAQLPALRPVVVEAVVSVAADPPYCVSQRPAASRQWRARLNYWAPLLPAHHQPLALLCVEAHFGRCANGSSERWNACACSCLCLGMCVFTAKHRRLARSLAVLFVDAGVGLALWAGCGLPAGGCSQRRSRLGACVQIGCARCAVPMCAHTFASCTHAVLSCRLFVHFAMVTHGVPNAYALCHDHD